jgi:acetyl-CoA carboxylase biotin carboxylase subunit
MRRALNEYRIGGIRTSIPFHQEIMESTEFMWGTFDTGFLSRRRVGGRRPHPADYEQLAAVVAAMLAHEEGRQAAMHVGKGDNGNGSPMDHWRQAGRMRAQRGRW